jgi:lipopolysaccharide export system permease protein
VLKKVDSFVLKSFIGPLILTFFIVLIILLLQFLWLYVDDLAGKGLGATVLVELLYHFSLTFVPMALPLAILLASLMTFGNMGEFSELAALKASGISLQRIMAPLIVFMAILSIVSFFFSNNVLPYSTAKAKTLLYDIKRKKPDINLQAGTFYSGVPNFSIKVTSKDPVTNSLYKIIIYDHREQRGNVSVTLADSGFMSTTSDGSGLVMTLFSGYSFNEMADRNTDSESQAHASRKDYFREQTIVIPLSGFDLERSRDGVFKSNASMLTMNELSHYIDSIGTAYNNKVKEHYNEYRSQKIYRLNSMDYLMKIPEYDSGTPAETDVFDVYGLLDSLPPVERKNAITRAIDYIKDSNTYLSQTGESHYWDIKILKQYEIQWNKKLTMSFACLVFFFIGAPLGAIIRKGGLGMPSIISVLFFVVYYVISLSGEKLSEENIIGTFTGVWAASYILLPIGVFLTYKAATDSSIMNADTYLAAFKKMKQLAGMLYRKTGFPGN